MTLLELMNKYQVSSDQEGMKENQIRLYKDVDDTKRVYTIMTLEVETVVQ